MQKVAPVKRNKKTVVDMTARISDKTNANANANANGNPKQNSDNRRANKPLMEKRRRARINQSLAALKTLIVDSNKLEGHKHSKLEKADILEMTVNHLNNLKKNNKDLAPPVLQVSTGAGSPACSTSSSSSTDEDIIKYREGFEECTRQVSQFLDSTGVDKAVAKKLTIHLNDMWMKSMNSKSLLSLSPAISVVKCEGKIPSQTSPSIKIVSPSTEEMISMNISMLASPSASAPYSPAGSSHSNSSHSHHHFDQKIQSYSPGSSSSSPQLEQQNHQQQHQQQQPMDMSQNLGQQQGIHVIPTRLANGQVVFLLPNNSHSGQNTQIHAPPSSHVVQHHELYYNPDEPLDCSNKNSPVNLSCSRGTVEYGSSVWRPF